MDHSQGTPILLLLSALACACARSEPAGTPAATPTASSRTSPLTVAPRATAAAPSASAAPPPAASQSSDGQLPERSASAGSTIGTIACGKSRCQAGKQVCVLDATPEWICAPARRDDGASFACDDASDCQAGATCCRSFASAELVVACAKPDDDCAALVCSEPDGTKCPRGQRCKDGYCQQETQATCGAKRCPKDAPFCNFSAAPTCVDEAAAIAAISAMPFDAPNAARVYACTKPSDCGTLRCCSDMAYGSRVTHCQHACDPANSMQLCAGDSECKALARIWCEDDAACRRAVRCVPPDEETKSALPGLKICRLLDH